MTKDGRARHTSNLTDECKIRSAVTDYSNGLRSQALNAKNDVITGIIDKKHGIKKQSFFEVKKSYMQKTSIKLIYPFIILGVLFSLFFLAHIYGVFINVTPSMPVGIYIRDISNIQRGDIAVFCLKEP